MKTTSIREFRSQLAEIIDSEEPVLITRHGKGAAVLYPLRELKTLPLEIRKKLFRELTDDVAKQLDAQGVTDEDIERAFGASRKHRRR